MNKKGLTLIELLLVFSLVAILATGAFISFVGSRKNQALAASANNLQTVLNRARIYSRDIRDETAWGVIKNNSNSYDLVKGNPENIVFVQRFNLDSPIVFDDSDFKIWFKPGSGDTDSLTKIILLNPKGKKITITVTVTGLVELN